MSFPTCRLLVVSLCSIFYCFVSTAQSSVLIVTNTQDSGDGSLRATVTTAAAGDTVQFNIPTSDPGYDPLTSIFTIRLTSGEIVIQSDLTIANVSGAKIAISGNHTNRILNITSGTVSICDLSLINGMVRGPLPTPGLAGLLEAGGAISNQGILAITRCTFMGNSAIGGVGSSGVTATMGGDGQGGAIANQGTLSLVACTLAGNSAQGGPGGTWFTTSLHSGGAIGGVGSGGAIHNAANGTLSLMNCTIASNSANGVDAHHYGDISGYGSAAQGGGIANFGNLTIVHCTVARNIAQGGSSYFATYFGPFDGAPSFGGGLYCAPESLTGMRDVILAPNTLIGGAPGAPPALAGATAGPDFNGSIVSAGHNLLGRSDGAAGFGADDQQGGTTDETRLDPMLGDLADNGGPTQTLALLPGSPAINTGALPGEDRDQRYFLRAGHPDVGAFEYQGTQPVMLANISTRLRVRAGDNAMIGGFIITGTVPKTVILRGIGPSLPVANALADPIIELHGGAAQVLAQNDDWRSATTSQAVIGSGLPPTNDMESALWETLNPGAYSVVVRGKNNSAGIALFEVYDVDQTVDAKLANVSTRGFVETEDNAMIGGTIIVGSSPRVLFRAIGPSLTDFGVSEALQDPTMAVYDSNGQVIATNDNWRDNQESDIMATGIEPTYDAEAAIVRDLSPGPYTSVLRGVNDTTGVALIEVYDLN